MCDHDSTRSFLLDKSYFSHSSVRVLEIEFVGFLDVIQVTISNEMHNVDVEFDSKVLSDALATNTTPSNKIDNLVC